MRQHQPAFSMAAEALYASRYAQPILVPLPDTRMWKVNVKQACTHRQFLAAQRDRLPHYQRCAKHLCLPGHQLQQGVALNVQLLCSCWYAVVPTAAEIHTVAVASCPRAHHDGDDMFGSDLDAQLAFLQLNRTPVDQSTLPGQLLGTAGMLPAHIRTFCSS